MPVTSQLKLSSVLGETWISDWQHAGLLKPSVIKPVLATIEQRLILRRLGHLTSADITALRRTIAGILG